MFESGRQKGYLLAIEQLQNNQTEIMCQGTRSHFWIVWCYHP